MTGLWFCISMPTMLTVNPTDFRRGRRVSLAGIRSFTYMLVGLIGGEGGRGRAKSRYCLLSPGQESMTSAWDFEWYRLRKHWKTLSDS
jgi:hypothetical protein